MKVSITIDLDSGGSITIKGHGLTAADVETLFATLGSMGQVEEEEE